VPIARRTMRGIHGLVVLAQELGAFALGQIPENYLRVIRVLDLAGSADMRQGYALGAPGPLRRAPWLSRLALAQPEATTSCHRPPFRLMLLPLAWPGPLSPM
jgi:hypothetical protein